MRAKGKGVLGSCTCSGSTGQGSINDLRATNLESETLIEQWKINRTYINAIPPRLGPVVNTYKTVGRKMVV